MLLMSQNAEIIEMVDHNLTVYERISENAIYFSNVL